MTMSYNYTVNNGGLDTAASYPYVGKTGTCKYNKADVGAKISGWRQVSGSPDGTGVVNVSAVQEAVALRGPVAVGIDANSQFMQFYHGGFYR